MSTQFKYTFTILTVLLFSLAGLAWLVPAGRTELASLSRSSVARIFSLSSAHADDKHESGEKHKTEAEHAEHNETEDPDSLALTDQALKNIGIMAQTIGEVELGDYSRTITFPAVIVERPGQTLTKIPAPAVGIVEKIYIESGQMIERGQPLFEIHLTHEDVISNQYELLTLLRKRDIIEREEKRLDPLEYGIAPMEKRDIEYQRLENTTAIDAMKKTLAVHGLPLSEIETELIGKRNMIDRIVVYAPTTDEDCVSSAMNQATTRQTAQPNAPVGSEADSKRSETTSETTSGSTNGSTNGSANSLAKGSANSSANDSANDSKKGASSERETCAHHHQIDEIFVKKGQMVDIGDPLCQISDLDVLFIQGRAYAYNESILREAMVKQYRISATLQEAGQNQEAITGLAIRNIDNRVDPQDRTLNFYVELHNELDAHDETARAHRGGIFLNWRFKPGQRGELAVEYDKIAGQIVLPVGAIVRDLNECYVFEWVGMDGKNRVFKRRSVHVIHQGKDKVAIENDGALLPGASVALTGASQLLTALTSGSGKLQSACPCGNH